MRTRVAPDARFVVEPERTTWATEPGTTVKVSVLLSERPLALAVIVTLPASAPVRVLVATPAAAVALPSPVTEPAPDGLIERDGRGVVGRDRVAARSR